MYTYNKYFTNSLPKITKRFYSSNSKSSFIEIPEAEVNPIPVLILYNLTDKSYINSFRDRDILKYKGGRWVVGGIYSFINIVNGKQYIGSAKDLYIRFNEDLNNKKSNILLQAKLHLINTARLGLEKFNWMWMAYEYFTYDSKIISKKALTDLETSYIRSFDFSTLFNF